jgi:hypothetical protein
MSEKSGITIIRPGAIPAPDNAAANLMDPGSINPDAIIEHAKKVSDVIDKLASFGLSLTEPRHWVAYSESGGGRSSPWLTAPGAEILLSKLSLQVEYIGDGFDMVAFDDEIVTDRGSVQRVRQYLVTCKLRVSIGGWSSIACEGHTTTKDPFFSRGGRLKGSQVDLGNVRQAAYSNALVNGVCRLLGIRGLRWDDVRRITDGRVDESSVDSATFKRGGKGGKGKPTLRLATKDQRAAVWNRWVDVSRLDPKDLPKDVADSFRGFASSTLERADGGDYYTWTESDLAVLHSRLDALRDLAPPPVDQVTAEEEPPPKDSSEGEEKADGNADTDAKA